MTIVEDSGLEVLRKAAEVETPTVYRLRTTGSGVFTPAGLHVGGLITEVALNSVTWTALPAGALLDRNAIALQNRSGIEVKINYSASVVGYVGIVIADGNERQYDITDDIILYGKSETGTPTIIVEEIA